MIKTCKAFLYVSGISLFLQFLNGRGGGGLSYSTSKSRGGAFIRAGTLIKEKTVFLIGPGQDLPDSYEIGNE